MNQIEDVFKNALPKWFVDFDRATKFLTLTLRHGTRAYYARGKVSLDVLAEYAKKTTNDEGVEFTLTVDEVACCEVFEDLYVQVTNKFIEELPDARKTPLISKLIRDAIIGHSEGQRRTFMVEVKK